MSDAAADERRTGRRFGRLLAPVRWGIAIGQVVLSRRGLQILFLLGMAVIVTAGWLRPPISNDIRTWQLPLLSATAQGIDATTILYGPRTLVWLSPGVLLLAVIVGGLMVCLLQPRRYAAALGVLLAATIACAWTVVCNHPELTELMDQQLDQRQQLVRVLSATADPPIRITDAPRVRETEALAPRDTLLRSLLYLRLHGGLAIMLPALALMLSLRGPLTRRMRNAAFWALMGCCFAITVTLPRLAGEWYWQQALAADLRGAERTAEMHTRRALGVFPQFARLQRTWLFLGKLNYRLGKKTNSARVFRAAQMSRNGELERAIDEIADLARHEELQEITRRWLGNLSAQLGLSMFEEEQLHGAADAWRRSVELDPTQQYRPLLVATMHVRLRSLTPDAIAEAIDPLLPQLRHDRTLRAAMLSLLGDAYFRAGQYAEARVRYNESADVYSLPKHINYRAQRGLLGM